VGVAFTTGEQAAEPEALMSAADAAMYRAKSRGGGLVDVFDEDLRRRVFERGEIEREVRAGLDDGAVRLAFQPIVCLDAARPPAAEALLRWQRPGGPALSAADVVSVAEQVGLIPEIGEQVLSAACRTARRWLDAGDPVRVSVNVSARQLVRPEELIGHVRQALEESGLPPALLALEMTVSVLMENMRDGEGVLRTLRALGAELEIDDFGVGYSSLSYLHRLPIDSIKIDRSFIAGLPEDQGSARILEAIVGLARAFGIHTTAEGVETREQLDAVRAAGCDAAQGYLLARPAPADELPDAMARGRAA
jgi:EAL domain-containing protein (putative c-di-GMP-specific phosphodiesterase class I)